MNRKTWAQDYTDLVGKWNKLNVRCEPIKDARGKFWGRYAVVNADTGVIVTTFDFNKAKLALH